jgi:sugar phosphate isomerase/epimerase
MLCYSTASLPDRFTASDIAIALLPSVFRGVEYVVKPHDLARADDASYWRGFRTELETRGLGVRNVQLGHPFLLGPVAHSPGLSSLVPAGPSGRARRLDAALAAGRIAVHLGSPYLTVTTGLPSEAPGGAGDFKVQEQNFLASLTRLVAERPKGLKIAIEQEPEHVIHRADQLLALCRAFEGVVFANYDVGHGVVAGEDPAAAVRLLGGYVSNLHLEDIKGRTHKHLMFGEGDVDFRALFRALRETGYAGDVTMDLYPFKDEWQWAVKTSAGFLKDRISAS